MEKIGVGYAYVSDKEKKYVNEALDAERLSQGEMVHRFEKEFARLHDQKYGIACNSGTSALHVALECLAETYGWPHDGQKEVLVIENRGENHGKYGCYHARAYVWTALRDGFHR